MRFIIFNDCDDPCEHNEPEETVVVPEFNVVENVHSGLIVTEQLESLYLCISPLNDKLFNNVPAIKLAVKIILLPVPSPNTWISPVTMFGVMVGVTVGVGVVVLVGVTVGVLVGVTVGVGVVVLVGVTVGVTVGGVDVGDVVIVGVTVFVGVLVGVTVGVGVSVGVGVTVANDVTSKSHSGGQVSIELKNTSPTFVVIADHIYVGGTLTG
jgi:hypothetical protein